MIVHWFGRPAGSSGMWAGGLSAITLLTLATLLTRGCTRTWVPRLHEFVGAFAVIVTPAKKTFPNPRGKATEDYSSGRFG